MNIFLLIVLAINIVVLLGVYGRMSSEIVRLSELVEYLEMHSYRG